jgi:ABC-2 type transport system permease protein
MRWSVFWETVRGELRGTILWGLGLGFFGFITTSILPDSKGMQEMVEALEALPPFFFQMLGVDDLTVLATPAGFISLRYFLTAAVIFSIWAVLSGLNVITNDETRGIANMVVSLPLSRGRIMFERLLANIVPALVIPMIGLGGLALGMTVNPNAQTDLTPLALATLMLTPVGLLILNLTVLVGAAVPRRGLVAGVAGGFIATSFLLKSVAGIARSDFADTLAELSVYHQSDAVAIIRDGFPVVTALILLAMAAAMAVAAASFFQSRDLAA